MSSDLSDGLCESILSWTREALGDPLCPQPPPYTTLLISSFKIMAAQQNMDVDEVSTILQGMQIVLSDCIRLRSTKASIRDNCAYIGIATGRVDTADNYSFIVRYVLGHEGVLETPYNR